MKTKEYLLPPHCPEGRRGGSGPRPQPQKSAGQEVGVAPHGPLVGRPRPLMTSSPEHAPALWKGYHRLTLLRGQGQRGPGSTGPGRPSPLVPVPQCRLLWKMPCPVGGRHAHPGNERGSLTLNPRHVDCQTSRPSLYH